MNDELFTEKLVIPEEVILVCSHCGARRKVVIHKRRVVVKCSSCGAEVVVEISDG